MYGRSQALGCSHLIDYICIYLCMHSHLMYALVLFSKTTQFFLTKQARQLGIGGIDENNKHRKWKTKQNTCFTSLCCFCAYANCNSTILILCNSQTPCTGSRSVGGTNGANIARHDFSHVDKADDSLSGCLSVSRLDAESPQH